MEERRSQREFESFAFRALLEYATDLIFFKDLELRYTGVSKSYAELVGCEDSRRLEGKTVGDFFPPELTARLTENDRHVLETGAPVRNQLEQLPFNDGRRVRYTSISKYPIRDAEGRVIGLYGIGRDVTVQLELEEELERGEQPGQVLAEIVEADLTEDRILHVDGSLWSAALGLENGNIFSEAMSLAETLMKKEDREEFRARYSIRKLREDYKNGIKQFSYMASLTLDGEHFKWVEFTTWLYHSGVTGTLRLTIFLRDLDAEVLDWELLRQKAETDPLTGLLNRESAIAQIEDCLTGYGAEDTHALLFIDLDSFKRVNDEMGHPYGDRVLVKTGEVLHSLCRASDIVGRIGGDEFIVLLKNVVSGENVGRKLRRIFDVPISPDVYGEDTPGCSVGVTFYRGDGKSFAQLYAEADKAMYAAKAQGFSRVAFYEDGMK